MSRDPNRDWGRPSGPVVPPGKSARDDKDGCALFVLAPVLVIVIGILTYLTAG